jgi:mannitol/fructose-specific phosphotransferase system IIA component (Ntr-type)
LRALIDREEMHSTGVGDGVALPHARNPLQTLLTRPQIVFGRHPTGITYGSIDGQPAQLFFLLLATNMSQHLHILARVSRLMRQAAIRQQLLSVKTPEEVMAIIRTAEASLP